MTLRGKSHADQLPLFGPIRTAAMSAFAPPLRDRRHQTPISAAPRFISIMPWHYLGR